MLHEVTHNKIVANTTHTKTTREVYDFQVADNENFFVGIGEDEFMLTHNCLLKPLEEAGSTDTVWVLCSMDPSKFSSTTNGKAIAKRCTQFVLSPHANSDLLKQGMRIARGEKMGYLDKELIKTIVKSSDADMRTLANLIAGVRDYYDGLEEKPATLSEDILGEVIQSTESSDDKLVVDVIVNSLLGQFAKVQRALMDVQDGFAFMQKLIWAAKYQVDVFVLDGARHSKVWATQGNREITNQLKSHKVTLGLLAALLETLVKTKLEGGGFTVDETTLLSVNLFRFVRNNVSASK
jgi:hypothetical protein